MMRQPAYRINLSYSLQSTRKNDVVLPRTAWGIRKELRAANGWCSLEPCAVCGLWTAEPTLSSYASNQRMDDTVRPQQVSSG